MPVELSDEPIRHRLREALDRNVLVEAGAGTGKTTLLVDRIEALVSSGRARLRDLVAITFTEQAAAELRVKVQERIERRLHEARDAAARARYRQALVDLELAPISTIHAFCASLLRERPVEAGVDPGFQVADELTASLFRTEAWDRWLARQKEAPVGALREAIEDGVALGQLRRLGDALLRYRDVVFPDAVPRSVGHRDVVPEDAAPRDAAAPEPPPPDPLAWLRRVEPELRGFIAAAETHCFDPEDRAARFLADLAQRLDVLARLDPVEARRTLLATVQLRCTYGRQASWAPGVLPRIKDRLQVLQAELDDLRAACGHRLAAGVARWLQGYVETYQDLKAQEGLLDFDDLLLRTRDLLRDHPEVRRAFQQRFAAILVDEFQDTDPLQAEVVFFLAEDPQAPGAPAPAWDQVPLRPGALFLVGDPKQSVYAFRRADIETYERAKTVLARSGTVEYITANFRSVQEILDGVNALFRQKMRRPLGEAYQPDYVPLAPSQRTVRVTGPTPALVLLYPDVRPDEEPDAATLRRREAEGLAAFLRHQIDRGRWLVRDPAARPADGGETPVRPARFGDVAVLFRGMGDVPLYEEALARYGIPYRVTSSRTFYRREEVGWLVNVLHAVEHPTDPIAVWGALRSPFFGCSDREVYELVASGGSLDYRARLPWEAPAPAPAPSAGADSGFIESIDAAYRILRGLHRDRHALSVPAMVEKVLARTQARITFLLTHQGEQRVANLTKVVTLARALEESGVLTFRAFVHWLRDMEEQAVDEAESPTVEEGDNVVRLMSIHAAKGLEFPVVVLADLGRGPGGQADPVVLHRLTGQVGVSLGRVEGWAVHTREYEALKDGQARREDAERLRLLYVGMTRARDALVLAVVPGAPERSLMADLREVAPWPAAPGTANDGWAMLRAEAFPRLPDDGAERHSAHPAGEAPAAPSTAERESWMARAASCREAAAEAEEVMTPSHQIDHDALGRLKRQGGRLESEPGGRRLGTLVHRVLALLPPGRGDLAEAVVSYVARQMHASASMTAVALGMVRRGLSHLAGVGVDEARVWREVPFAAVGEAATLVSGAMDLLAALPAGLLVVDYKTDHLPGPSRQVIDAVYRRQIQSYQSAVRRMGFDAQVQLLALDDVYGGNFP
ncbi:MAG: UvrD-helicase domain-containing protein [Armatimonadota bacterium]|nr:UvrD-helicase domain-containing protein [Armatimonadota bacterium]MDR7452758.1 UvrD-helicase domain-containing protein [Armatimonadota bacterium]MDR7505914.1 UvrD-helicase domain-containing protein [Armatimonadota bacterium]